MSMTENELQTYTLVGSLEVNPQAVKLLDNWLYSSFTMIIYQAD